MRKAFLTVAILLSSFAADAANYNVQLGQSASLQNGDVALVRYGNGLSAITCGGGGGNLPSRQQFEIERFALFSDLFQNSQDGIRQIQCSHYSVEPQIKQALADALNAARETCFSAGYSRCMQPMTTNEQYGFYVTGTRPGDYGCDVLARIVGTNP